MNKPTRDLLTRIASKDDGVPVYLAHAARGRYVLVGPIYPDGGRLEVLQRMSGNTLWGAIEGGLLEFAKERDVDLQEYRSRRHLDSRMARRLIITPSGREAIA